MKTCPEALTREVDFTASGVKLVFRRQRLCSLEDIHGPERSILDVYKKLMYIFTD
jgi:hypothetical protein